MYDPRLMLLQHQVMAPPGQEAGAYSNMARQSSGNINFMPQAGGRQSLAWAGGQGALTPQHGQVRVLCSVRTHHAGVLHVDCLAEEEGPSLVWARSQAQGAGHLDPLNQSGHQRMMGVGAGGAAALTPPRICPTRRVVTLVPFKGSDGQLLAHDPETGLL